MTETYRTMPEIIDDMATRFAALYKEARNRLCCSSRLEVVDETEEFFDRLLRHDEKQVSVAMEVFYRKVRA